MQPRLLFLRS